MAEGYHFSEEAKKKLKLARAKNSSSGMKGKHHSEKTKKQISINNPKIWLGKKLSKERIQQMKEMKGEKASNWKGGLTYTNKLEKIAGRKKPEQCDAFSPFISFI